MFKPNVEVCASIANPRVLLGPIMHNAAIQALGLDYIYLSLEPNDLSWALQGMRSLGFKGYSVSQPYKEKIIRYLDDLDDIAEAIGAVNTVHNKNGVLKGYNSDWIGAARALEEKTEIAGKQVIVIGAGGAGRAIAYGLKSKGAGVTIYNRTIERAKKISNDLGVVFGGSLEDLLKAKDYDILINATSVGSSPDAEESVVPANLLKRGKIVLDVVFNPVITRLIHEAREQGCIVALGTRMLVLQGAFQFELFTGREAPTDVMQEALEKALVS